MPSWQEGLIHEIIHHVTGSSDPSGDSNIELGPTEILARRVAQELGWSVPDFKGYAEPEREAHLRLRNLNALRQAAMRHEENERAFFEGWVRSVTDMRRVLISQSIPLCLT